MIKPPISTPFPKWTAPAPRSSSSSISARRWCSSAVPGLYRGDQKDLYLHRDELPPAPTKQVLSMHCSANAGTKKEMWPSFSASPAPARPPCPPTPNARLIGDDEHGWSDRGIFNFEGGCYAKVIKLSPTAEPEIYETDPALWHHPGKCGL